MNDIKLRNSAIELSVLDWRYRMTGRTTRLVDEYVQKLFEAENGEWIYPIDHANRLTNKATENLILRIVRRMENEHGINIEVRKCDRVAIRIPIDFANRLAENRKENLNR